MRGVFAEQMSHWYPKSSTAQDELWANRTAIYKFQACTQVLKEVIPLISGCLDDGAGTSNTSGNMALCNNMAKSTYSPCSICCLSCGGTGGNVEFGKYVACG